MLGSSTPTSSLSRAAAPAVRRAPRLPHASAPPTLRCLRATTAGAWRRGRRWRSRSSGGARSPGGRARSASSRTLAPTARGSWAASAAPRAAPTRCTSSHCAPRWWCPSAPTRTASRGSSSRRPRPSPPMQPQPPPPAAAAAAPPPKPPPQFLDSSDDEAAPPPQPRAPAAAEAAVLGGAAAARAPPPTAARDAAGPTPPKAPASQLRRGGRWRGATADLGGGRDVSGPARVGARVAGAAEARAVSARGARGGAAAGAGGTADAGERGARGGRRRRRRLRPGCDCAGGAGLCGAQTQTRRRHGSAEHVDGGGALLHDDGARGRQVWVLAAVPPRGAPRLRGAVGAAAHAEAAALALRGRPNLLRFHTMKFRGPGGRTAR